VLDKNGMWIRRVKQNKEHDWNSGGDVRAETIERKGK